MTRIIFGGNDIDTEDLPTAGLLGGGSVTFQEPGEGGFDEATHDAHSHEGVEGVGGEASATVTTDGGHLYGMILPDTTTEEWTNLQIVVQDATDQTEAPSTDITMSKDSILITERGEVFTESQVALSGGVILLLGARVRISNGDVEPSIMVGSADPSAGGGVSSQPGSLYLRDLGDGNGQAWIKTGAGDTAWARLATV